MTKKKLLALILAVSFIFFGGASFLNFSAAKNYTVTENGYVYDKSLTEMHSALAAFNENEEKDFEYLQRSLRGRCSYINSDRSENVAYAYALTDKQGNVIFSSESGVWFWVDRDMQYISLEEYMTPEIKKDLTKFLKKADGDILLPDKLNVNFLNGEYLPVSIEFTDNRFNHNEKENERITVKFTDLETTHTFDSSDELICELYNLENDNSYDEINEALDLELKTFDYASESHCSRLGTKEQNIVIDEGDYFFIILVKIDLNRMVLNSSFFGNQMLGTAIVFIILTAAALGIATVVFNKSFSKDKRTKEESYTEEEKETTPVD